MAKPIPEIFKAHRETIEKHSTKQKFSAGSCIFREGETDGDKAYIIIEGEVSVVRQVRSKEKELAVTSTGDILGEVALFSVGPRTATARAKTDVTALVLSRQDFQKLKEEDIAVAYELVESILSIVANRLRSTLERLEVIYFWLT
ncbi:MAG: cyclic nucleotide-binding domain-containing protein [Candidatus Lindowbacteria bacterium]|nr:cyclic nucleotide-binding domain-containing protein [Candidatus Lindowbacteria bacterium]